MSDIEALATDPALAPFLKEGVPAVIWRLDGTRVLWASQAAKPIIDALAPDGMVINKDFAQNLALLAQERSPTRGVRLQRIRLPHLGGNGAGDVLTCACHILTIPNSESALLTAVIGRLPERLLQNSYDPLALALQHRSEHDPALVDQLDNPLEVSPTLENNAGESVQSNAASITRSPLQSNSDTSSESDQSSVPASAPLNAHTIKEQLKERAKLKPRRRFVWETDHQGRFVTLSHDITEAIGVDVNDYLGKTWWDLMGTSVLDPSGEVAEAFTQTRTWTARNIQWRVAGTDVFVSVDMSAVPLSEGDGEFSGYRGFGICHLDSAFANLMRLEVQKEVDDEEIKETQEYVAPEQNQFLLNEPLWDEKKSRERVQKKEGLQAAPWSETPHQWLMWPEGSQGSNHSLESPVLLNDGKHRIAARLETSAHVAASVLTHLLPSARQKGAAQPSSQSFSYEGFLLSQLRALNESEDNSHQEKQPQTQSEPEPQKVSEHHVLSSDSPKPLEEGSINQSEESESPQSVVATQTTTPNDLLVDESIQIPVEQVSQTAFSEPKIKPDDQDSVQENALTHLEEEPAHSEEYMNQNVQEKNVQQQDFQNQNNQSNQLPEGDGNNQAPLPVSDATNIKIKPSFAPSFERVNPSAGSMRPTFEPVTPPKSPIATASILTKNNEDTSSHEASVPQDPAQAFGFASAKSAPQPQLAEAKRQLEFVGDYHGIAAGQFVDEVIVSVDIDELEPDTGIYGFNVRGFAPQDSHIKEANASSNTLSNLIPNAPEIPKTVVNPPPSEPLPESLPLPTNDQTADDFVTHDRQIDPEQALVQYREERARTKIAQPKPSQTEPTTTDESKNILESASHDTLSARATSDEKPSSRQRPTSVKRTSARLNDSEKEAFREIARVLKKPLTPSTHAPEKAQPQLVQSSPQDQAEQMMNDLSAMIEEAAPAALKPPDISPATMGDNVTPLPTALAHMRPRPRVITDQDPGFAGILKRLPMGVIVLRGDECLYANQTFLELVGYSSIHAINALGSLDTIFTGRTADDFDPEEAEGSSPLEVISAKGERIALDASLSSIVWQGKPATLLSFRRLRPVLQDIARLKALELEYEHAKIRVQELSAILDTATDGVVVLDDKGRILSMNRSAEALFGYDQNEMVGELLTSLLAGDSQALAMDYLEGLISHGVASLLNDGREVVGRVRQGGHIPLFMTIGNLNPENTLEGERRFCAVIRDLTSWKKAEKELLDAKKNAEKTSAHKSEFLAKISHEIRTPLNAILGFTEVMRDERFGAIGNERYRDYIRDIHTSGQHVISLVNDLLDLAKIEAGKADLTFTATDLNALLEVSVAILHPQAIQEHVVVRTSLAPKLPMVVADERSLKQIALNLLSNAIKFTPDGGQVIVSTELTEQGEVVIRFRDTGIGMSGADMKAALEPFRQVATSRRSGGTGLGLPLTKALVEANRGAFSLTSEKGHGTLVEITFPTTRVLAS